MSKSQANSKPLFLGIDQTGAITKAGRPKPLEAMLLREGELIPCRLERLTQSALCKALAWPEIPSSLTIIADCVLGLPQGVRPGFYEALARAGQTDAFGRLAAQAFFESLERAEPLPRREVEVRCKANSVFQTHPFQKNIQTGTFRMWKDLAAEPGWFHFPVLDSGGARASTPIFEGYPSLSWKQLFGVNKRSPERLAALIQIRFPEINISVETKALIEKDPNLADAAVLALAGWYWLYKNKFSWLKYPKAQIEGWILGAD